MIISKHIEDNCDGRNNTNILEDIYEALLGAISLDTGSYEKVQEFIIKGIEKHIDFSDILQRDNNYKDQILRYFQHNFKVHPTYETTKDETRNVFVCKLFKGDELIDVGEGKSKKKSEQEASKNALTRFHVLSEEI